MTLEQRITAFAGQGLTRKAAAAQLGMSYDQLRRFTKRMPDLRWARDSRLPAEIEAIGVEAFIRQAAARNWTHKQTRTAMNMNASKFAMIVQALPDVAWAPRGVRGDMAARVRDNPRAIAGRAKGRAVMMARHTHTVNGRSGTIPQLAREVGLAPATINRRLATMSLAEALAKPSRRRAKPANQGVAA